MTNCGHMQAIDLFCGAGGLSEGLREAGLQVIAGTDSDPDACATFAHNFPVAAALCGDIRDPALREQVSDVAAGIDVIVGGPPCQAFSQVRNHTRLIDDPRNSLYREFVRTAAAARPAAFLMENVPGMAQMGVQEQVLVDLALDGEYEVEAQLCDAADFGVSQIRRASPTGSCSPLTRAWGHCPAGSTGAPRTPGTDRPATPCHRCWRPPLRVLSDRQSWPPAPGEATTPAGERADPAAQGRRRSSRRERRDPDASDSLLTDPPGLTVSAGV